MESNSVKSVRPYLSIQDRLLAGAEVLIGAVVVIGHNVYRFLPNEVPILVLILWISLLIRRKPWKSIGLSKPDSWGVSLAVAVAAGALLQLKDSVTEPFAHWIWRQPGEIPQHSCRSPPAQHSPCRVVSRNRVELRRLWRGVCLSCIADAPRS